ncbi:MAG TPA: hypothetical protein VGO57_03475 [Verrucomicrobiae bacterium]|jgi:chaperonin cofactor prefoldin
MAERAQVTSVEVIEAFRSELIVYLAKARAVVEEITNEVPRARNWLQTECYQHWEQQRRLRLRKLEEARNELFTARLSQLQSGSAVQLMAVQRAERALREAEAKLLKIKKWDRDLGDTADPLLKQVGQLQSFLSGEMPRAVVQLTQMIKTLEAYADIKPVTGRSGGTTT